MKYQKTVKFAAVSAMIVLGLMAVLLLTNPRNASAFSDRSERILNLSGTLGAKPGTDPETKLNTTPETGSNNAVFIYNGREYDLTQKSPEINAIVCCTKVGPYLVVEGHIGPHNGYYGIFNTVTEEFEADLFGSLLTYDSGFETNEDMELSDFVYSFWNDIYDGCGNLIASCQTGAAENIYNLRIENGYLYVDILDIEAGTVVRTESFPLSSNSVIFAPSSEAGL